MDKPLATNYQEALKIEEARKRTGRKIMVYQPYRVSAPIQTLKKIINSGVLGDIYMIKKASTNFIKRNDWQAFKKYGGGIINNYASHYLDYISYLLEQPLSLLKCHAYNIASGGDAEDVAKILLKSEMNQLIDIDINMATAIEVVPWMIFGTLGTAVYKEEQGKTGFFIRYVEKENMPQVEVDDKLSAKNRAYCSTDIPWKSKFVPDDPGLELSFYEKCREYFVEDKAPFVPFEETLRLMKILQDCKISAGWE